MADGDGSGRRIGRPFTEESMLHMVILQPLAALVAGILILVLPRVLNYIVAIYLIVIGIAGLLGRG